jgi:hypothetical protein
MQKRCGKRESVHVLGSQGQKCNTHCSCSGTRPTASAPNGSFPFSLSCSRRLLRHEQLHLSEECRRQLLAMNAATADRRLASQRKLGQRGLHHASRNAAEAADSHPHLPRVEADPTRLDFQWTWWFIVVQSLISTLPLPAVQPLPAAPGGDHRSHVQACLVSPF